jgi:hypothetical protein
MSDQWLMDSWDYCNESWRWPSRILDSEGLEPDMTDNVNHPAHYGQGKIECIEYIQDFLTHDEFVGYLRGNIAKYLHRWRYKNGLEDLHKAQWYLNRLVQVQEERGCSPP